MDQATLDNICKLWPFAVAVAVAMVALAVGIIAVTHSKADRREMRPLQVGHVVAAVGGGLLAVVFAVGVFWLIIRPADSDTWADVIRSSALALAFLAAVPAGYVAYRRQHTAEGEHRLDQVKESRRQDELDDANERATRKDFRDRFTAAATQIGSDKAPIRLAGVYALAQLADEWGRTEPDQRQTCIDVLCSYLRMPWPLKAPDDASEQEKLDKRRLRDEETRVRETILRTIAAHLHKDRPAEGAWHQNNFDFTGADLPEVNMSGISLEGAFNAAGATFSESAVFVSATFSEGAYFSGATFLGGARFSSVTFSKNAYFNGVTFLGDTWLDSAMFSARAEFDEAKFTGHAGFDHAVTFSGDAGFGGARFLSDAGFSGARFAETARFQDAEFHQDAGFASAVFTGTAQFGMVTFFTHAEFTDAAFADPPIADGAIISGTLTRPDRTERSSDRPAAAVPSLRAADHSPAR